MGASQLALLSIIYGKKIGREWPLIRQTSTRRLALAAAAAALPTLDYTLIAIAIRRIDVSTAAVIIDIRPLFLIPATLIAYRGTGRFSNLRPTALTGAATCVAGVFLLGAAETGNIGTMFSAAGPDLLIGLGIALASSACLATSPFLTQQCELMSLDLERKTGRHQRGITENSGIMYLTAMMAGSNLVSALAVSGIAIAITGGEHGFGAHGAMDLAYGLTKQSAAAMAWRIASTMTDRTEIFSLIYAIPVVALIRLALTGQLNIASTSLLVAGTAAIVGGNLLTIAGMRKRTSVRQAPAEQ